MSMALRILVKRFVPVSSRRLADCALRLRDARIENAALLPLFEPGGEVRAVVVFSPRTRECWVLDWRPKLFNVPLVRPVRVDAPRGGKIQGPSGDGLWFHDPRGLLELGIASLCGALAARNAAALLPKKVKVLVWRRDLSRIAGVWTKSSSSGDQLGRWKPEWLTSTGAVPTSVCPQPAPKPSPSAASGKPSKPMRGWVLDPVWR